MYSKFSKANLLFHVTVVIVRQNNYYIRWTVSKLYNTCKTHTLITTNNTKQDIKKEHCLVILIPTRNCHSAWRGGSPVRSTHCSSKGLELASSTHSTQNTQKYKIEYFKEETVKYNNNKQQQQQQVPHFLIKFLRTIFTHIERVGVLTEAPVLTLFQEFCWLFPCFSGSPEIEVEIYSYHSYSRLTPLRHQL